MKPIRKMLALAVPTLLGGLMAIGPALGFDLAQEVVVANQMIHPVRASAGGLSPEQRVSQINDRLAKIIAKEPLAPSNIRVRMRGDTPGIYAGRYLITSVTQADADANRTSQMQLARLWLRRYRAVLPQARPDMNYGVRAR
jgi:hypothetical protein